MPEDWKRPAIFPDSIKPSSGYKTFTCVLCGESCNHLKAISAYNNTSRICQYCHHAELMLLEHAGEWDNRPPPADRPSAKTTRTRSGQKSYWGCDIIPLLGTSAQAWHVIYQYDTKAFTDAWGQVVTAEPVLEREDVIGQGNPSELFRTFWVWTNPRPLWSVWRTCVLMFSQINHVHAWLTDIGKWMHSMEAMKKKRNSDYVKSWQKIQKAAGTKYGPAGRRASDKHWDADKYRQSFYRESIRQYQDSRRSSLDK